MCAYGCVHSLLALCKDMSAAIFSTSNYPKCVTSQVSPEDLVLHYNIVYFQWGFAGPVNELLVSSCNSKHSSYMRLYSWLEILVPRIKLLLAVLPRLDNCYIHAMQSCASLLKNTGKKRQWNSEICREVSVQVQWFKKSTERIRKIQIVYLSQREGNTTWADRIEKCVMSKVMLERAEEIEFK